MEERGGQQEVEIWENVETGRRQAGVEGRHGSADKRRGGDKSRNEGGD